MERLRFPSGGQNVIDSFGRAISYLRLSLTDRCNMRCLYCLGMGTEFLPKSDILGIEDLGWACDHFIKLGIRKIRLTGGEPLLRKGVMTLVDHLGAKLRQGLLEELTLTTNGSRLAEYAAGLSAAGIRRVNVSLDSLDPSIFREITHCGTLSDVLDGISAAKAAGLTVKINMVVLKGINETSLDPLISWCGAQGLDLVLIELMPLGRGAGKLEECLYLPMATVRQRLERQWTLVADDFRTAGPARYARIAETGCRVGFITPMSHCFCGVCNRVRLTATGRLYPCLGQKTGIDLRQLIRCRDRPEALEKAIRKAVASKPSGHDLGFRPSSATAINRQMNVTGG